MDLAGREWKDLRYAYVLTFNKQSKKVEKFEAVVDLSEWGRLMGSTTLAAALA